MVQPQAVLSLSVCVSLCREMPEREGEEGGMRKSLYYLSLVFVFFFLHFLFDQKLACLLYAAAINSMEQMARAVQQYTGREVQQHSVPPNSICQPSTHLTLIHGRPLSRSLLNDCIHHGTLLRSFHFLLQNSSNQAAYWRSEQLPVYLCLSLVAASQPLS